MNNPMVSTGDENSSSDIPLNNWLKEIRASIKRSPTLTLADFFRRYPDAMADPLHAVEIIYEAYCLRREHGSPLTEQQILDQFPQWRSKLEVVFDCDRVIEGVDDAIDFPEPGSAFGDFHLIAELGRGAKGRVFLARQPSLSDRPVVLKIASTNGDEHQSLARLQHTAIVPLLFSHDDAECSMRTLCMPYLGGCTLEIAMGELGQKELTDRCGHDFTVAITKHESIMIDAANSMALAPAIRFLSSATYQQAVCWIIACLADGLHYAHQRGLVHLDVKPSNVLLANDGQPMLLDFHLARDLTELAEHSIGTIGGTPGYLAPEQLEVMNSLRDNTPPTTKIDQRSDLYSLSLMLYDLLQGEAPPIVQTCDEFPTRTIVDLDIDDSIGDQELRRILRRSLASEPAKRYQDGNSLAIDLRAVALGKGSEPSSSPGEYRFWWGAALGTLITCSAFFSLQQMKLLSFAEMQRSHYDRSTAQLADELHSFMSQARTTGALNQLSGSEWKKMEHVCERIWENRSRLLSVDREPAYQIRLENDLSDLATLYSELVFRSAASSNQAIAMEKIEQIKAELKALRIRPGAHQPSP